MELMEIFRTRTSIRKFKTDAIEPEKLAQIAESFRLAPSARNNQHWKLLIVTCPQAKSKIREAAPMKNDMIVDAHAVLVGIGTAQRQMSNGHRNDSVDVSIAMTFAMLKAHELGLGTCWMAHYSEPGVRAALNLPDDISVVAIMPLGVPDEMPEPRPRKGVDEIVEYLR